MQKFLRLSVIFLSVLPFLPMEVFTQIPAISSVVPAHNQVEQFGKFEASIGITTSYNNPYDYDQVAVQGVFLSPEGISYKVDGFFMQGFELNTTNGQLTKTGIGEFKIRFSPNQPGTWSYSISVRDSTGVTTSEGYKFSCFPANSLQNKGFIKVGDTHYSQFDNGDPFIPIGENIAWPSNNPYIDYQTWLKGLSENKGNFFRLWQAHWGLGLEWKNGYAAYEGLMKYNQPNARYLDWLYDHCADQGIYVMVCFQHHGQVSTQVDPNWNESPYNTTNGGPCGNTWEFFSNAKAIQYTQNRIRYTIARWGYARSIMAWELFNEVDWTDNYDLFKPQVGKWKADMAFFTKQTDPYGHLVTTSYANTAYDPVVWVSPDIDMTQTHFYLNTPNLERALAGGTTRYLIDYGKPSLNGEFGLGGSSNLANRDASGIHIHNALWGSLFSGGMGAALSWWWDSYIHHRNLYYHFKPLATVTAQIPFVTQNMKPARSYITGTPDDLELTPTLGWGTKGDTSIILKNGATLPRYPALSSFLYGSTWNTQFRSPPAFQVDLPSPQNFVFKTADQAGTNPRVAIYLDGILIQNSPGVPDSTYTLLVPAGKHSIKIDNPGTDWISVKSYFFEGQGSKIESYVLMGANKDISAGWLLQPKYNHINFRNNVIPASATGGNLVIEGVSDGAYKITWFDCLTGIAVEEESATAANGTIELRVPSLVWDLAFILEEQNVSANRKIHRQQVVSVYPNPAPAGSVLTIEPVSPNPTVFSQIQLFNASGLLLETQSFSNRYTLPTTLPAGMYWIRLGGDSAMGSVPIVVR